MFVVPLPRRKRQNLMFSLILSAVVPFLVEKKGILVVTLTLDHIFALPLSMIQLCSTRGLRA